MKINAIIFQTSKEQTALWWFSEHFSKKHNVFEHDFATCGGDKFFSWIVSIIFPLVFANFPLTTLDAKQWYNPLSVLSMLNSIEALSLEKLYFSASTISVKFNVHRKVGLGFPSAEQRRIILSPTTKSEFGNTAMETLRGLSRYR